MPLTRPWIALAWMALAAGAAPAAVIYKWVDAQGVVHYSDQPTPGAERIVLAGPEGARTTPGGTPGPAKASGTAKGAAGFPYGTLTISSPTPEQSFFGDDPVPVALQIEPALQPDHVIAWFLNGKHLEDQGPQATTFSLQGLPRGSYTLGATVTNPQTGEAQSSEPVTFYVQQPSLLSPQHKH